MRGRETGGAGFGFREACVGSGLDRDAESRGVVVVCGCHGGAQCYQIACF